MTETSDKDRGAIDLHRLLPSRGDSVLIVNCGDHFELRGHSVGSRPAPLVLTDEDIDRLTEGKMIWH